MLRSATILVALVSATSAFAKDVPSKQGWSTIDPAGGTVCADGSAYRFHARPRSNEKLVVFFNGGGACWSAETCDPKREHPIYTSNVSLPGNDPANGNGIFDAARPDNPFRDWSVVFVPYCTGDSHIGARRVTYALGERNFAIEHKGYVNTTAVLDWVFQNYPSAKSVLVTGVSAGAIAAPFYAGIVAQKYPNARVSTLGDAAGGYRSAAIPRIYRSWGVEDVAPDWLRKRGDLPLNTETFYKVNATAFPQLRQAQYNNVADEVQGIFLRLLGETTDIKQAMRANLTELRRDIPGFRSYLSGGKGHTILQRPAFYDDTVEGVPLFRWVGDFAEGKVIEDVDCADDKRGCTAAP